MSCESGTACDFFESFNWMSYTMIIFLFVVITSATCAYFKMKEMMLQAYLEKYEMRTCVDQDLDEMISKPTKNANSQLNENCTIFIPDIALVL